MTIKMDDDDWGALSEPMSTGLVFLDVETTGLDPYAGQLLEVALVVTDERLNIRQHAQTVIARDENFPMDDVVLQMHTDNGLLAECDEDNAPDLEWAEDYLIRRLLTPRDGQDMHKPLPMAGSKIAFDRAWLKRHMPRLASLFHYRDFDVNTLRIATGEPKPSEAATHRALDDVLKDVAATRKLVGQWQEAIRYGRVSLSTGSE